MKLSTRDHKLLVCDSEEVVAKSEKPHSRFLYTPSLLRAQDGSLILSYDVGGDLTDLHDFAAFPNSAQSMICRIESRQPNSTQFQRRASLPMCHGRLFAVGNRIYLIGHNGFLQIAYSDNCGATWSDLFQLSDLDGWHGSSCNVHITDERLYLCMERRADRSIIGWNVAGLSPHVLSAAIDSDLTCAENWSVSHSFSFAEIFRYENFPYFGMPYFNTGQKYASHIYARGKVIRSSPMGWLEGNIVRIEDDEHVGSDPERRSLLLMLRMNTAGVGYAAVLKVVEVFNNGRHEMYTEFLQAPSGERYCFFPLPGGHNKFYILRDDLSRLYWMASTQASDSMVRLEYMPSDRHNLPNSQRNRLVLYHSSNCIDWIFSGVISIGSAEKQARNYPSMVVDGSDLLIASRAGTSAARDSQYTDAIMLHKVRDFRRLVY